ncbi:glycosyltransferase [Methylobacillus glycogenes]|uniref:glycosyltransferase n=1 Tax=Methylobacillus glycogenes TaxID=406 RepID=UPI000472E43C|nr:glycosyltransferase [Methylobacillus glycogenes]
MNQHELPSVAVLLASFNGRAWIAEQLASILAQQGVKLHVFIADDLSTDGTWEWLNVEAACHQNVTLLPHNQRAGSAGRNFYRLIHEVDLDGFDFVAFADQDDVWDSYKLSRHARLMKLHQADGVSSNVEAFWPDGRVMLIVKSQAQRQFDYLFESAGPGCTFLMTTRLAHQVRNVLQDELSPARDVTLHDWLTYAIARSLGYTWVIDANPSLKYRQHGNNVIGANVSLKAKWTRLKQIRDGWYRQQVIKVTRIAYAFSQREDLQRLLVLLEKPSLGNRLQLLPYAWHGRRSVKDRLFLMFSIVFKWF